jgi:hypothetical protein
LFLDSFARWEAGTFATLKISAAHRQLRCIALQIPRHPEQVRTHRTLSKAFLLQNFPPALARASRVAKKKSGEPTLCGM